MEVQTDGRTDGRHMTTTNTALAWRHAVKT